MRSMTLTYEWQQFYKAAISETNPRKMQDDIAKAERAIQRCLADRPPPIMDADEKRAIGDALAALAVLKTDLT
jgi:hypothetical protein